MKKHILIALRLSLGCILVFVVIYSLLVTLIAQAAPQQGRGETVTHNGRVIGYRVEGQNFTAAKYFNSRPSAAGYNAAASSGSNKGTGNAAYLQLLQDRIDSFLVHNPGISKEQLPAELITASGSGLDPDLSPAAARVQVKRIAASRKIDEQKLYALINLHTQTPLLGILGPARINVLALNLALDSLQ
ncbi:MAG TPA: potassium-transporting ATPase subunit KdpC [Chitinophagaceae bacterium]|nr:potassium-transporting ATPase subunit KdpC [Chitinophagaceae bacterium]